MWQHYTIGNAYVQADDTYPAFNGRSVTMVGNKTTARRKYYINRSNILTKDNYVAMNMTHYSFAGRQQGLPRKPCVEVLYDREMEHMQDMGERV